MVDSFAKFDAVFKFVLDCAEVVLEVRVRVLLLLHLQARVLPLETESDRDHSEEEQDGQAPVGQQQHALSDDVERAQFAIVQQDFVPCCLQLTLVENCERHWRLQNGHISQCQGTIDHQHQ